VNDVSRETELAERYAGIDGMAAFAEHLGTTAVERGLIGPREVPRLWSRHLANCAVVAEEGTDLIPEACRVADVGSGAGLPGVVWALIRSDLQITLIEPLLRRASFLQEVVQELGLSGRVRVTRARAEDAPVASFDVVTARAVARLPQLLTWTVPLTKPGGHVLALKGSAAADEVALVEPARSGRGIGELKIRHFGQGVVEPPTTVVVVPVSGE
jgi:16S rRNA (guanine527-N7)-methyltransferase